MPSHIKETQPCTSISFTKYSLWLSLYSHCNQEFIVPNFFEDKGKNKQLFNKNFLFFPTIENLLICFRLDQRVYLLFFNWLFDQKPITFRNNRSWVRMQYFLSILLEILIFLKPHFFITFFLIELNRSCLEINNRSSKRPQEILLTTAIDHPQDDLLIFKLNSIKNTTVLLWQQVIILPIFHLNVQNILLFLQTQQIRCPVYVQRASTMERK